MSVREWGGKREGAGRPTESRTLQTQKMRDRFVELCYARSDEIFDALITAALGKCQVMNGERVYAKAPDVSALREICNRLWGQPTATVDLSAQANVMMSSEEWGDPEMQKLVREFEEKAKAILIG